MSIPPILQADADFAFANLSAGYGFMRKANMKYSKKYIEELAKYIKRSSNHNYLSRHTELESFDMPKTFYFRYLPDRRTMHWATISQVNDLVNIYFIDTWGRVFDKLEFKNIKVARRLLRKNGFDFSTNKYCPITPPEPIYIKLSEGKKSAPYSKGNLWQGVQRNRKHTDKLEKSYFKHLSTYYELWKAWKNNPNKYIIYKSEQKFQQRNETIKEKFIKIGWAIILWIVIALILNYTN